MYVKETHKKEVIVLLEGILDNVVQQHRDCTCTTAQEQGKAELEDKCFES